MIHYLSKFAIILAWVLLVHVRLASDVWERSDTEDRASFVRFVVLA